MRVNFNLKDKHAEITALYASISAPTRWKYFIGLSVSPKVWDQGKQRVKPQHPNRIQINRLLDKVEKEVYDIWLESMNQGRNLTKAAIKTRLDIALGKQEDTSNQLIPFIDKFIKQSGNKPNTVKMYWVVRNRLKKFNPKLTFDDIDLEFFYQFTEELKRHYKPNTVWGTIKNLKVFMQDAYDRGLHTNEAFKHKKFSTPKVEVEKVYLNEDELDSLFRKRFSPRLQKAVNLFLVMAWTGVRYSDLYEIDLKNIETIDEVECVRIQMQKTEGYVTIPLHPTVQMILNKYEYQLPQLSGQKINQYIKEAAKMVGIDKEPIFCHTARTSMICNLYMAGFPEQTIMKMSGHKKYASFQTYISKLTHSDHVKVASRFWQNKKGYLKAI